MKSTVRHKIVFDRNDVREMVRSRAEDAMGRPIVSDQVQFDPDSDDWIVIIEDND